MMGVCYEKANGDIKHNGGYKELINAMLTRFPVAQPIMGEQNEKDFTALFGSILGVLSILTAFDDFKDDGTLTPRQLQDYQSVYLDLYQAHRRAHKNKEDITSDVIFGMELVRQIEINIDYILMLVEKTVLRKTRTRPSSHPSARPSISV